MAFNKSLVVFPGPNAFHTLLSPLLVIPLVQKKFANRNWVLHWDLHLAGIWIDDNHFLALLLG